jgi:hypothetical protein
MFRMNGMPRAQGCAGEACVRFARHPNEKGAGYIFKRKRGQIHFWKMYLKMYPAPLFFVFIRPLWCLFYNDVKPAKAGILQRLEANLYEIPAFAGMTQ